MTRRLDLLILGGGGPIGRGIVRAAEGRAVLATSRRGADALDVTDAGAVERRMAAAQPGAVVYLVNDRQAAPDQAIADLRAVFEASARAGVRRFLFASSAAVYGDEGKEPYREDAPLRGRSDYAVTKIRSEEVLARSAGEGSPSVLRLRIFNVFGPGCDDGLVNRLVNGPAPRLVTSSAFVRDYVHVDDVAAAFLAGADRPDVGGAINIGRGVGIDNCQLAAAAADRFEPVDGADVSSYSVADVARARSDLGWTARIDPLAALAGRR